jgi:CMP-N-acetylneuraminic acid synthetase
MIKNYNVFGLILARGGSKRIPGKNTKELCGKPLLWYTINAAQKSQHLDRVILSSDDSEIIAVAKQYGVEVPFVRPSELAADTATDFPVFTHALEWLEKNENYKPDIVVQLRPTSPLRTAEHIDAAIELLAEHPEADSVRTVAEPEQSPYKMYRIDDVGYLEPLIRLVGHTEAFNLPQQKLPKAYKHVGYVDAMWRRTIIEKKQMTGTKIIPLILDDAVSGINKPEDWERLEYLMRKRKS